MPITLGRLDGNGCRLRLAPGRASALSDVVVRAHEEVRLVSGEIGLDDYVCIIRVADSLSNEGSPPYDGAKIGWVRSRDLCIDVDNCIYSRLDDDLWLSKCWQVHMPSLQIVVSHGESWSVQDGEELDAMGIPVSKNAGIWEQIRLSGYTYVSLEVGRPFCNLGAAVKRCHITLAYASSMEERLMENLKERL